MKVYQSERVVLLLYVPRFKCCNVIFHLLVALHPTHTVPLTSLNEDEIILVDKYQNVLPLLISRHSDENFDANRSYINIYKYMQYINISL